VSEIKKYRKKPVVIEAYQLSYPYGDNAYDIAEWCGGEVKKNDHLKYYEIRSYLVIHTLEGDHLAKPGDYIIKGVRGEFYPCDMDIFEETYDEVKQWGDHDVTEV